MKNNNNDNSNNNKKMNNKMIIIIIIAITPITGKTTSTRVMLIIHDHNCNCGAD